MNNIQFHSNNIESELCDFSNYFMKFMKSVIFKMSYSLLSQPMRLHFKIYWHTTSKSWLLLKINIKYY